MKTKRIICLIIISICFIPFMVDAETCDSDKIYINSIVMEDKSDSVVEVDNAGAQGKDISLNLKMTTIGNNIKYKINVKNDSNEDFILDRDSTNISTDYIDYTIKSDDNSNIVKAKSSKTVYLIVKYSNPVPDNAYENGIFKDNITMKVNLSTENSIINPNTGIKYFIFINFVLLLMFISFLRYKNKKNIKAMILIICLSLTIPVSVHALCKCNISIKSNVTIQEPEEESYLLTSAITQAYGNSSDTGVKKTSENNQDVYYYTSSENAHLIFNDMCWRIIRTTDTGGVKIWYYGKEVDNKCIPNRGTIIVPYENSTDTDETFGNTNYTYSDYFEYDDETRKFKLSGDIEKIAWNSSNKNKLISKFTCKSTNESATCSNLYFVGSYVNETSGYVTKYASTTTRSHNIGQAPYNTGSDSPAYTGYMYNTVFSTEYAREITINGYGNVKYSHSFSWDGEKYTLSDDGASFIGASSIYGSIGNRHYTCWNESGICNELSYVYQGPTIYYYLILRDGNSIESALEKMLYSNDVNKYNSATKAYLDSWYKQKMTNVTSYLEDTTWCANRTIESLNTFDINSTHVSGGLYFNRNKETTDLTCPNVTDQFRMNNTLAKLDYPVGLLTLPEVNLMGSEYRNLGYIYGINNVHSFNYRTVKVYSVTNLDISSSRNVNDSQTIIPAVSLKSDTRYTMGDGSAENPYIIKEQ